MAIDNNMVNNMIERFISAPVSIQLIKNFTQAFYDMDIAIHYDDDLNDYVGEDDQPAFTPEQANALNGIINKMFDFCDKHGLDIHEVAGDVQQQEWKKRGIFPDEGDEKTDNLNMASRRADNELELNGIEESELKEASLDMSGDLTSFQYKDWMGESTGYFDNMTGNSFMIKENKDGWLTLQETRKGGNVWNEDVVSFRRMVESKKYEVTGDKLKINEDHGTIQNRKTRSPEKIKTMRNMINHTKADMEKEHESIDNGIGAQKVWQVDAKINESQDQGAGIMDYLAVAKQALEAGKIAGIMDSPISDPRGYDGDVYFTIENLDGSHDTIQKELGGITMYQNIDSAPGMGYDDDDISLEGFKKYLLGGMNETLGDNQVVGEPKVHSNNALLDLTGQELADHIKTMSRESIISWLQSNDPNGIYDDGNMIQEEGKPLTWREAAVMMYNQIARSNGSGEISESIKKNKKKINESMSIGPSGGLEVEEFENARDEDNPDSAYDKGREAFCKGADHTANPFVGDPELKQAWYAGWKDTKYETLHEGKSFEHLATGVEFKVKSFDDHKVVLTDGKRTINESREKFRSYIKDGSIRPAKFQECVGDYGNTKTEINEMAEGDLLFQKVFGAWLKGGAQTKKWIARKIGVNNDERSIKNELGGMGYDEINEIIETLGLIHEGLEHVDSAFYDLEINWRPISDQSGKPAFYATDNGRELEILPTRRGGYLVYIDSVKQPGDYKTAREAMNSFEETSQENLHPGGLREEEEVDTLCAQPEINCDYVINNGEKTCTVKVVDISGDILRFRIAGLYAQQPRTTSAKKFYDMMCSGNITPKEENDGLLEEDDEFFDEGPQPGDSEYHGQSYNQDSSDGSLKGTDWRVFYDDLIHNNSGGSENMSDFCEAFEIDMDGLEFLEEHGVINIENGLPKVDANAYSDWQSFKQAAMEAIAQYPDM